jgi:hypothetical protein
MSFRCVFGVAFIKDWGDFENRISFLAKEFFSRQNFLFKNTKEKFGGKKIYFANERGPLKIIFRGCPM